MTDATKGPFSEFTVNNAYPKTKDDPSLRGKLVVIVDGQPVAATWAAFGPYAPSEEGSRHYYRVRITPNDPELAAKQTSIKFGRMPMPDIANANAGLKLDTVGEGVLFATTDAEKADAEQRGVKVRSFFGGALVLTPQGPRAVDLSARHIKGEKDGKSYDFHSGWASLHDPQAAAEARAGRPAGQQPGADRKATIG